MVSGLVGFQQELQDWSDDLDDVDFTRPKNRAVTKAALELRSDIQENIDHIPHNLRELRESWRYSMGTHEDVSVYTKKEYAPAFEYGADPYTIDPGKNMAINPEHWDGYNPGRFGAPQPAEDGNIYLPKVEHPGFRAYFYFTEAFNKFEESGRFEEIMEEQLIENELEEKWS